MDNYQLIFINFDNTINLVNKNQWSNMNNNNTFIPFFKQLFLITMEPSSSLVAELFE